METQSAGLPNVPRENRKVAVGDYMINPPDILLIELLRAVPQPPYKIKPLDELFIQVKGALADEPIKGVFRVEPQGIVRLGPSYGSVKVAPGTEGVDLTIEEAEKAIGNDIKKKLGLKDAPQVSVSLETTRGIQLIKGPHLVQPDGTVNLGLYGRVPVAGMTQEAAKTALEQHLTQYFVKPSIALDIGGFNSSVYYIIFDGGGSGEQVIRLPFTGSETVLDAIGQVSGLPAVASKRRVWLARPYEGSTEEEVLPIDWCAITQKGRTATNYQLFPGDRIYVAAQPLVAMDTALGKALAPIERMFGIVLLGSSAVHNINNNNNGLNNGQ